MRVLLGNSHGNTIAQETDRALTLYVDPTGDDANPGTVALPVRQVQAALDLVPKRIRHSVTINVAAGTYDGFALQGFYLSEAGSEAAFTISGALAAPTLTGLTSGTADSGDKLTLTDALGNWGSDDLEGHLLKVGTNYRVIESNTATVITLASQMPSNIGTSAYEIVEPKSIINTKDILTYLWPVSIQNCNVGYRRYLTIEGLDIQAPNGTEAAFTAYNTGAFVFRRSKVSIASGGSYGVSTQTIFGEWAVEDVYISGTFSWVGMSAVYTQGVCRDLRFLASGLPGRGARFIQCNTILNADFSVIDNTSIGVDLRDLQYFEALRINAAGNGSHGIEVRNGRVDATLLTGTGNTSFGANVRDRGQLEIAGTTPTLTGTSGDSTVDGSTPTAWTTLNTDGAVVPNNDMGARILRED